MNPAAPEVVFRRPDRTPASDAAGAPRDRRGWRRLGNPYTLRDGFACLRNTYLAPGRAHDDLTHFLPATHELAAIAPRFSVAFLGDLMPSLGRRFRFGERLRQFVGGADCLAVNLEGVISADHRIWNGLRHDRSVADLLESLMPARRTIIGVANNHAADCGPQAFADQCRFLEERGFSVIGTRARPSVTIDDAVQVTSCSFWANLPCDHVAASACIDREAAADAKLKILFPHWGYEMQLYPGPRQIAMTHELLRRWDAVVGHHSHCPQPVVDYAGRLVAYSLGNLVYGADHPRWRHGLAVKVAVGPDAGGTWRVGRVAWSFIGSTVDDGDGMEIDTVARCEWFPGVIADPLPPAAERQRG